ncbi:tartrate dehydrogenase [Desulfitobacterium metallireducens]|uniref:3-IPM-DH n=1 Tax=Desulfitobacterium metallireducens DSM 15288 TaxID=871968 RepID=W0E6N0_9FIRM|nr:tartrate dehydrogenase [Desulfitobacterium metallireducens]AHF06422.1 tartrate dehydrogenase [Desulfitobacterium metallireducens DSM 15288]
MRNYKIASLPGDGIGIDVTAEAVKVLDAVARLDGGIRFEFQEFPWGTQYYLKHGEMMPKDALAILASFDSILLGAVGDPSVADHVTLWGMLLPIRQSFQEYVNLRPIKLLPGIESPLKNKGVKDIDMVFVRENTEGEYSGVGGRVNPGTSAEVALQTGVFTRHGTERILRFAFEVAQKRPKKHLTSVTKSNACNYSMVFWDEVFKEVGTDYADIHADQYLVDAMAAFLVTHPERFDVIVASNLFGDILTDIGSAIMGSIGLGASANIDPSFKYPSMFEPIHGSAPDIQGMGIANPLGAIGAVKMLLEHHGENEMAELLQQVIEQQITAQKVLTPDLGGTAKTWEVGDDIVTRILASR